MCVVCVAVCGQISVKITLRRCAYLFMIGLSNPAGFHLLVAPDVCLLSEYLFSDLPRTLLYQHNFTKNNELPAKGLRELAYCNTFSEC